LYVIMAFNEDLNWGGVTLICFKVGNIHVFGVMESGMYRWCRIIRF